MEDFALIHPWPRFIQGDCRPEAIDQQVAKYGDLEVRTEQTIHYDYGDTYEVCSLLLRQQEVAVQALLLLEAQYSNCLTRHAYMRSGIACALQGETLGTLRHGTGRLTCANGDVYTGWWQYGMRDGQGHAVFDRHQSADKDQPKPVCYDGQWKEDRTHGSVT